MLVLTSGEETIFREDCDCVYEEDGDWTCQPDLMGADDFLQVPWKSPPKLGISAAMLRGQQVVQQRSLVERGG